MPQPPVPSTTPATVSAGLPIPPINRIQTWDDVEWEEFILEWATSLKDEYSLVERFGGAGDKGVDVIATVGDGDGDWDNFQCKHYQRSLYPSDIWLELAKVLYYTHVGDYSIPRKYSFVAPQGAGTALSKLLKKPDELRAGLIANWDAKCKASVTTTQDVEIDDELRAHIEQFDFSIFGAVPPLKIIEEHSNTEWHVARFGGGLPPRPDPEDPPTEPAKVELKYVKELCRAYGDHLNRDVKSVEDLVDEENLRDHYHRTRSNFYSAESLRIYSRETLPSGEFEGLQGRVHDGIRDEWGKEHEDGYARLLAVTDKSGVVPINDHALFSVVSIRDRYGICHQLVNDGQIEWWAK